MYLVPISFTNRYGSPFHWDFQVETDDYAVAVDEAVLTFWSGLTFTGMAVSLADQTSDRFWAAAVRLLVSSLPLLSLWAITVTPLRRLQ